VADTFERGLGVARERTVETPDGETTVEMMVANPTSGRSIQISARK